MIETIEKVATFLEWVEDETTYDVDNGVLVEKDDAVSIAAHAKAGLNTYHWCIEYPDSSRQHTVRQYCAMTVDYKTGAHDFDPNDAVSESHAILYALADAIDIIEERQSTTPPVSGA